MMKIRAIVIVITGILLGFLVVIQARSFSDVQGLVRRDTRANIFRELQILKTTNKNLEDEIVDLEDQLAKASDQEQALKAIKAEIEKDEIIAGHVDIQGPGVEVTIQQDVPMIWMTDLINDLWSAGAEAISVNNIRITNSTMGFDTLPNGQIALNGVILTAPYHFQAIGEPKILFEAVSQPQGIIQRLNESLQAKGAKIEVTVDKKDLIIMQKVL